MDNSFKIISWNINGIKSLFSQNVINRQKELENQLDYFDAPIICLQEAKVSDLYEDVFNTENYNSYFSLPVHKKGYSGVVTYTKREYSPLAYEESLSGQGNRTPNPIGHYGKITEYFTNDQLVELDSEGRVILTLHQVEGLSQNIILINVYIPRLDPEKADRKTFKLNFLKLLSLRCDALRQAGYLIIITGDFNIRHTELDVAPSKDDDSQESEEEGDSNPFREWFSQMIQEDFIDSFRYLNPTQNDAFTCWCTKLNSRIINFGTRIDYFLLDQKLKDHLINSSILSVIYGSDHCPIKMELNFNLIRYNDNLKSRKSAKITNFFNVISKSKRVSEISTSSNQIVKKPKITNFFTTISKTNKKTEKIKTNEEGINKLSVNANKYQAASGEWHKLFQIKKETPLCKGHQEECVLRQVTKPGINKGRFFWVCPRPPGSKNDTACSCNHFEWKNSSK